MKVENYLLDPTKPLLKVLDELERKLSSERCAACSMVMEVKIPKQEPHWGLFILGMAIVGFILFGYVFTDFLYLHYLARIKH